MINIFQPCLGQEELAAVERVFRSNWIGKGKEVAEFEKQFAVSLNSNPKNFTSTTCCTEGLFLAPELFNCEGYDVIVPTISFIGVGNAVLANNAEVVLCDVDPETLNVRAEDIMQKITQMTKMVYVTHFGGVPCDMEKILSLCHGHGVKVIEDAACAPTLSPTADMAVWSFDAMKILVTGDGGMIYLKDQTLMEKAKGLLYFGLVGKSKSGIDSTNKDAWWEFDVHQPGRRAIMNDISGAIGIEQLKKLPGFILRRHEISVAYRAELKPLRWLTVCPEAQGSHYMFWVQTGHRDKLARFLLDNGIYTTFRYWPLHKMGIFKTKGSFPNADYAAKMTLCLPIHQSITDDELSKIIETIKLFGRKYV
jgi:dTDP-4-amino-4,6-dideoxygalactose transaminase